MVKKATLSLLAPLSEFDTLELEDSEVLVTAAGFEHRALAAAMSLVARPTNRALVLDYENGDSRNRLSEILDTLREKGVSVESADILRYDRYDPDSFPRVFERRLTNLKVEKAVVDISAMSKLAILLCLDVCRELDLDVRVLYSEAERYRPTEEEYQLAKRDNNLQRPSIQLYTGVHGVVRASRLSSVAMQGQPTAAIAFMSFNELFTQALLNTVYPSRLFLINGRPPQLGWREEATAWIHEQLRREWGDEDNPVEMRSRGSVPLPLRSVSTLEYRETVGELLDLYWQLARDHRILLAPTGSKMQTVGCFFAKSVHPDIHIEYPAPKGFLELYSEGVIRKWTVSFGKLGQVVEELRRLDRKDHIGIPRDDRKL